MSNFPETSSWAEIAAIMQRLYRLRKRFRVAGPENLLPIQERLLAHGVAGSLDAKNLAEIGDIGILYDIGIVFSQHAVPLTMGEISREMDVPLSKATRIVDWLVNNQCAERLADPEDRRLVRVKLTNMGQEMYRAINDYFIDSIEQYLDLFSPADRHTFLSLLEKLLVAAEKGA